MNRLGTTLALAALIGWAADAWAHPRSPCGTGHGAAEHATALLGDIAAPRAPRRIGALKDQIDRNRYEAPGADNDGDGVINSEDALPNDPRDTSDRDGDGVGDNIDHFPDDPDESFDSDCDGIGDNSDPEFTGGTRQVGISEWLEDGTYGQQIAFDMFMDPSGEITVWLQVALNGHRDPEMEAQWEAYVESVWSQAGVTLDLEWVDADGHSEVTVHDGEGWADAGNFYTADDAVVIAHEIGHHLSLDDEYEDEVDVDRFIGEADSIMRVVWDNPVPYPHHFKRIRSFYHCGEGNGPIE